MLCKNPIFVKNMNGIAPCGQCLHCRTNKRRQKTTRCALEARMHEHALFVHLTYSDDYLPTTIIDRKSNIVTHYHPDGCLDREGLKDFLKRLRRRFPPRSIRVFYAGEYGEKTLRPHYHLVIWGIPYSKRDLIVDAWCDPITGDLQCDAARLWIEEPRSPWDVSQYCCGYTMKGIKRSDVRSDGRPNEFIGGSIGLGLPALPGLVSALQTPSALEYISEHNDIPRFVLLDGKQMPIDRYLRDKILKELNLYDQIKAVSKEAYDKEMLRLQICSPYSLQGSVETVLSNQSIRENAPRMALAESRASLFTKGKKL